MRLETWQKINNKTTPELARFFEVSVAHIHKYLYAGVIPRYEIMRRIFIRTGGQVTANDFYNTTNDVLEKELLKITKKEYT